MGSVVGAITGASNAKSANKANAAYAAELNGVRNQIRDAYDAAQKGWVDYIPELQQGISGNINFANQIAGQGSAYNNYLAGAAADSLGLGYQKATESIAPQLEGETYNLIKQTRDELIPAARSAAIDAGAYGGSRDYLTRERVQENLENQIVAQAAADIANQRAQTPSLLQADANSVNNYLNTGTAGNNLLVNAANQQQQADMAKTNYLWDLAMQYSNAMGSSQAAYNKQTNPWVSGLQGAYGGLGSDIKMLSSFFGLWDLAMQYGNAMGSSQVADLKGEPK